MNSGTGLMVVSMIAHLALMILGIANAFMARNKCVKVGNVVLSILWCAWFVFDVISLSSMQV